MWYNRGAYIDALAVLETPRAVHLIGDAPVNTVPHSVPSNNHYTVYALVDPRDDSIKYVGLSVDPQRRLRAHLTDREATLQKRAWLDELLILNIMPTILPLETDILSKQEGCEREKFWIQELLAGGEELLNSHPMGGRLRCRYQVEEILDYYEAFGKFPDGVSPMMQRYYKREYPKSIRSRLRKRKEAARHAQEGT